VHRCFPGAAGLLSSHGVSAREATGVFGPSKLSETKKNDLRNKSRGPDDTAPAKTCVFLVSPISGHGDDEYRFLPSKNHHRDAKHMAEKMFFFFSFFLSYLNVSNPEFGIDSSGFIPIY
jgi:hypothetical protein